MSSTTKAYLEDWAIRGGWNSFEDYRRSLILNKYPSFGAYRGLRARERDFGSYTGYLEHLAIQCGFKSRKEYLDSWAQIHGHESFAAYKRERARLAKKGKVIIGKDHILYKRFQKQKREARRLAHIQTQEEVDKIVKRTTYNREVLSTLIVSRLRQLGINQSELAERLDVKRASVSGYVRCKNGLSAENELELFDQLELPFATLKAMKRELLESIVSQFKFYDTWKLTDDYTHVMFHCLHYTTGKGRGRRICETTRGHQDIIQHAAQHLRSTYLFS